MAQTQHGNKNTASVMTVTFMVLSQMYSCHGALTALSYDPLVSVTRAEAIGRCRAMGGNLPLPDNDVGNHHLVDFMRTHHLPWIWLSGSMTILPWRSRGDDGHWKITQPQGCYRMPSYVDHSSYSTEITGNNTVLQQSCRITCRGRNFEYSGSAILKETKNGWCHCFSSGFFIANANQVDEYQCNQETSSIFQRIFNVKGGVVPDELDLQQIPTESRDGNDRACAVYSQVFTRKEEFNTTTQTRVWRNHWDRHVIRRSCTADPGIITYCTDEGATLQYKGIDQPWLTANLSCTERGMRLSNYAEVKRGRGFSKRSFFAWIALTSLKFYDHRDTELVYTKFERNENFYPPPHTCMVITRSTEWRMVSCTERANVACDVPSGPSSTGISSTTSRHTSTTSFTPSTSTKYSRTSTGVGRTDLPRPTPLITTSDNSTTFYPRPTVSEEKEGSSHFQMTGKAFVPTIVGIVLGTTLLCALAVALIIVLWRRKTKSPRTVGHGRHTLKTTQVDAPGRVSSAKADVDVVVYEHTHEFKTGDPICENTPESVKLYASERIRDTAQYSDRETGEETGELSYSVPARRMTSDMAIYAVPGSRRTPSGRDYNGDDDDEGVIMVDNDVYMTGKKDIHQLYAMPDLNKKTRNRNEKRN